MSVEQRIVRTSHKAKVFGSRFQAVVVGSRPSISKSSPTTASALVNLLRRFRSGGVGVGLAG